MMSKISEDVKKKIFEMISTPGVEIETIVKELNLNHDSVMKILSDEYFKHDLDHGRRMCCRF